MRSAAAKFAHVPETEVMASSGGEVGRPSTPELKGLADSGSGTCSQQQRRGAARWRNPDHGPRHG